MKKIVVCVFLWGGAICALAKHSIAPFAGYTPTYRFFLGGGYFYETEGTSASVQGVLTFVNAFQIFSVLKHHYDPSVEHILELTAKKGFVPYYGEGSSTSAGARQDVETDQFQVKTLIEKSITKPLVVGMGFEGKIRREYGLKTNPAVRFFPNESTWSILFVQRFDFRDREKSPRKGFLQEFSFRHSPAAFGTTSQGNAFSQLELKFSWFSELFKDWVLACNLEGGLSIGEPTYLYRYFFGGADRLRGFHENRFRGKHYYLQQTEMRFPIAWIFQGGAFLGLGDIGDSGLSRPRVSYGLGLRIALPPDRLEVARIDFGMTSDQYGLFIDFGYAF